MRFNHCDHLAHTGPGWIQCTRCGACCTRDPKTGQIVTYDRAPQAPREEALDPVDLVGRR
jgi:Fe-S-cluster containining protein